MDSDRPIRVGELLVSERLLGKEDLQRALAIQGQEKELRGRPIGEILVGMGLLSKNDLENLMRHPQMRKEIGAIAIEKGFIAEEELEQTNPETTTAMIAR